MAMLKWWDIHEIHREKIKNNTGPTPRLRFIPPGMWAWFGVCLDLLSGRTTIHVYWTTNTCVGNSSVARFSGTQHFLSSCKYLTQNWESWLMKGWFCSDKNFSEMDGLHRFWNSAFSSETQKPLGTSYKLHIPLSRQPFNPSRTELFCFYTCTCLQPVLLFFF